MRGWHDATYGDRWADDYDEFVSGTSVGLQTPLAVETLASLAQGGRVLELAIGTGRLAVPLAERGLDVHGIDASEAMLAKLRSKPGSDAIIVHLGDFADVAVDGDYALVFVAFNTLFALATQDDQARCFRNVAAHLEPAGCFVVEAFVPDLSRFDRGQRVQVSHVDLDGLRIEGSLHDAAAQTISTQQVVIDGHGMRLRPIFMRYAYPTELDLMAQLAGLRLRERWGGWDRRGFDAGSVGHVSVYERV